MLVDAHLTAEELLDMLNMGPGDLEPYVITPGQIERLEYLLTQLQDPVKVFEVFGFEAHRGQLGEKPVMICNGGMYAPAAAIATEIFCTGGAHTIIRAGSCGSLQPGIEIGHVVIATGVVRGDGVSRAYVPDEYPAVADLAVTQALIDTAEELGIPYHVGLVWTTDAMLRETEAAWKPLAELGVKAVDMVTSPLFTISSLYGARAGAVLAVADNLPARSLGFIDLAYYDGEMRAVRLCVEALKRL